MSEEFSDKPMSALDVLMRNKDNPFTKALHKRKNRDAKKDGYKGVVQATHEFERIFAVPLRELDLDNTTDLTCIFRKDGGTMNIRPLQSAALIEGCLANGLFAPIPVGEGKTLITLLMAEAMDSERTVILVPSQLRGQLAREIEEVYGPHFNLPMNRIVRILSYSELSLAKNSELLDELEPDLFICDEVQNLAHKTSARTKRFLRYMRENPHCRLVAMSGTMTNDTIKSYAHIMELCLRKNSLLPVNPDELNTWAAALDVKPPKPADPGVLKRFLLPEDKGNIRLGYRRRLLSTLGVVSSSGNDIGTALTVQSIQPKLVPTEVTDALEEVADTWAYNGEEYASPLSFWRFQRQMSSGFYYRWVWPSGAPNDEDVAWLEARSAWKKALRERLKSSRGGMDSELLLTNAAKRWCMSVEDHSKCEGEWVGEDHSKCTKRTKINPLWDESMCPEGENDYIDDTNELVERDQIVISCKLGKPGHCDRAGQKWSVSECGVSPVSDDCTGLPPQKGLNNLFPCEEYVTWRNVKRLYNPTPPTEPVVVSEFLVHDAIQRAQKHVQKGKKVIIWYVDKIIGEMLAEYSGFLLYGAGTDASIADDDCIICSITTQGTGKNLQYYNVGIIMTMPTSGKDLEQLLGRKHRPGQMAERVLYEYYDHTESLDKCMDDCIADSMYIQDTNGGQLKILYADGETVQRKKIARRQTQDTVNNIEMLRQTKSD